MPPILWILIPSVSFFILIVTAHALDQHWNGAEARSKVLKEAIRKIREHL